MGPFPESGLSMLCAVHMAEHEARFVLRNYLERWDNEPDPAPPCPAQVERYWKLSHVEPDSLTPGQRTELRQLAQTLFPPRSPLMLLGRDVGAPGDRFYDQIYLTARVFAGILRWHRGDKRFVGAWE